MESALKTTEKFVVVLLLASLALAGGRYFFTPGKPSVPAAEAPLASSPEDVVIAPPAEESDRDVAAPPERSLDELRGWALQEPHAAMAWAAQEPNSDDRDEVLSAACFQIAQEDPAQAVALAEMFNLTNHATLANLAQQWAEQDLNKALAWAEAKPSGEVREQLFKRIALVWSQSDPANAASLVVERIPAGPEQNEAAMSVLHQWSLRDLQGAMAWVRLFPEGDLRDRALEELAGTENYRTDRAALAPP
jgi:hypothetical protein